LSTQTIIKEEKYKGYRIKIIQDDDYDQNDDEDNSLFIVAYHRDFRLTRNKIVTQDQAASIARGENPDEQGTRTVVDKYWCFNLEAYIHNRVVLALAGEGNFPDRQWDVSLLGLVLVERNEYWDTIGKAKEAARELIKEWNYSLSGEVYGYKILNASEEEVDSCWGFVGEFEYCLKEAKNAIDAHEENLNKKEKQDGTK